MADDNDIPPIPLPPVAPPARPDPYAPASPYAAPSASAPVAAGPPQGLSIAAMVTGIGAIVLSFVFLGLLPSIAAVVLGHLAMRRQPSARPFWLTGLITGYIALAISLIWSLIVLAAIVAGVTSTR